MLVAVVQVKDRDVGGVKMVRDVDGNRWQVKGTG